MKRLRPADQRGAIVLVALCFAAVLAISIASYLALSRSAMQLSNRSFQTDLSKYLAEAGLEVAMDAFNTNDWSSWTVSGTTATRTVTFAEGASKFGSVGVVGSIKLRVDNYNAYNLDATWVSTANYRPDNVVGRNGLWYRAVTRHLGQTPSATTAYWIPEQSKLGESISWIQGVLYSVGDMVIANGALYRCTAAHTAAASDRPAVGANWSSFWADVPYWSINSDLHYDNGSVLAYFTNWYRYNSGWIDISSTTWSRWQYLTSVTYSSGNLVYNNTSPNVGFYRYINTSPSSNKALSNSTYWQTAASDGSGTAVNWPWNSSDNYNIGDVVYDGGSWYRCIRAHSNQRPPNTTYWSNAPALLRDWDSKWQYSANDTVFHDGRWHLSRTSTNNYGKAPPTSPTTYNDEWYSADHASMQWSASTAYAVNSYRSYGGVWYRCIAANTGQAPNNPSYWSAAWAQSSGVTTGAPVVYSEGIATPPGNSLPLRSQLRAVVGRLGLFSNAIGATDSFSLGGTTMVNSYDSFTDPTAATPGASAVLAASGTGSNSASLSSATIRGFVAAPTAAPPIVSYSGSASLSDGTGVIASPSSSATNVDLARISRNPYIPRLAIQDVAGGTEITALDNLVLGTPGAVTPSVYYYDNTNRLDLNGSTKSITIIGPVIIKVLGSQGIRIRNGGYMRIAPTGSLRLIVNRDFQVDSSGNGITNDTRDPAKLVVLLKRSGNDSFNYLFTGSPFYGVVYLPDSSSAFTLADGVKFYGAISAQKVTLNGAAELHYDTNLRHKPIPGVDPAFLIQDWRELFGTERASL